MQVSCSMSVILPSKKSDPAELRFHLATGLPLPFFDQQLLSEDIHLNSIPDTENSNVMSIVSMNNLTLLPQSQNLRVEAIAMRFSIGTPCWRNCSVEKRKVKAFHLLRSDSAIRLALFMSNGMKIK
eukprot:746504-Hanusia_phi.AAC.14